MTNNVRIKTSDEMWADVQILCHAIGVNAYWAVHDRGDVTLDVNAPCGNFVSTYPHA